MAYEPLLQIPSWLGPLILSCLLLLPWGLLGSHLSTTSKYRPFWLPLVPPPPPGSQELKIPRVCWEILPMSVLLSGGPEKRNSQG